MQTRLKKHIAFLFFLLTLAFSTPSALLHHCGELNHDHSGLAFHTPHAKCLACDLKADPAEPAVISANYPCSRIDQSIAAVYYDFTFSYVLKGSSDRAPPFQNTFS